MNDQQIIFVFFLIFVGAVGFSTLAIVLRQSMLVAYILLGLFLGPYGARLIPQAQAFSAIGHIGIIFLLFLVGLDLNPRELLQSLKNVSFITVISSLLLSVVGWIFAYFIFHFNAIDSLLIIACIVFSSTVVGLNLMPNKILFHSRRGEIMVSILLLQDLLAIFVLFLLQGYQVGGGFGSNDIFTALVGLPTLLFLSFMGKKLVIRPLAHYFWHNKEYVFLLAIAWCLGLAELGEFLGLSGGVGAFIGGVSIASNSRTAALIRERLNPLRDFFLVLFFFAIGSEFNYHAMWMVIIPGIVLTLLILLFKPFVYYLLLRLRGEQVSDAKEIAIRLGQASEFALLISAMATMITPRLISLRAEYTIQVMILSSLIVSCYWVSMRYPLSRKRKKLEETL